MARRGCLGGAGARQAGPVCSSPSWPALHEALLLAGSLNYHLFWIMFNKLGFSTPVPKDRSSSLLIHYLGRKGGFEAEIDMRKPLWGQEQG